MTAKRWIVGSASLAAVAAVLVAGCGDGEELTGEEAYALALEVGAVSSMAWFEDRLEKRGDESGEYEYKFVIPCSTSGNVTSSGTSKLERDREFVTSFDVDGTRRYNACAEVVESGETMILSGTVKEGLSFAEEPDIADATVIDIKGSWRGTVVWSGSDGDSGECEVDLALDARYIRSWWSGKVHLRGGLDGRFCEFAVDAPFEEWYESSYKP